jgi:NNP family nitrate/nitrite transporter-like MFS transporter
MTSAKATSIKLLSFSTVPMRTFHMTWWAFFACFTAWFGIAPLMAVVRDDLKLTKDQIGNTIIASVAITVIARLLTGWLLDRVGPRVTYTALLIAGSLPVMGIGLSQGYESFLLFRLAIGAIGASFVITQYHTTVMFAPNVVGTANAMTAGWGNLGGGVAQLIMPMILGGFIGLGFDQFVAWRLAMIIPGAVMFVTGFAYYFLTQDTPDGLPVVRGKSANGAFREAASDPRVWLLFVLYGACFGVEITIHNVAALYFKDQFKLSLATAGFLAGLTGMMNIFARALGGYMGDSWGKRLGLNGRARLLGLLVFTEGIALISFSMSDAVVPAVISFVIFGLLVCMACGATYAITPFINPRAMGAVAGIIGAGGNVGAVLAGMLFKTEAISATQAFLILGTAVTLLAPLTLMLRFPSLVEARPGMKHQETEIALSA